MSVQFRSKSYLRPICDSRAVDTLAAILYHDKLHYSEKVLAAALLLEPGFSSNDGWKTISLKRGLSARMARKLGVPPSSITNWFKRIESVAGIKCY